MPADQHPHPLPDNAPHGPHYRDAWIAEMWAPVREFVPAQEPKKAPKKRGRRHSRATPPDSPGQSTGCAKECPTEYPGSVA